MSISFIRGLLLGVSVSLAASEILMVYSGMSPSLPFLIYAVVVSVSCCGVLIGLWVGERITRQ